MATSDFIYGGIFSAYIACFVFIGAYILIRRTNRRLKVIDDANHVKVQDKKVKCN